MGKYRLLDDFLWGLKGLKPLEKNWQIVRISEKNVSVFFIISMFELEIELLPKTRGSIRINYLVGDLEGQILS